MRKPFRAVLCLLMLAVLFTAAPAFALRNGGGGTSCYVCKGSYSEDLNQSLTWCGKPEQDSGGFSECNVVCGDFGSIGACVCHFGGEFCMTIVVEG
ncbi:MAG TPA: hypothetical protein VEO54_06075 [Thermoanaerobaculia bacterium]|nr:hypothetical protein [Thermoanaerobaculia bacterium]